MFKLNPEHYLPRPSSYPLLGPKYLLLGTIYPQLRVQGGSWFTDLWIARNEGMDPHSKHEGNGSS